MDMHILAVSPGTGFEAPRWRAVLASGVDGLLLRERQLSARALLDLARRVRDLAPDLDLWLAGRLDVALAAGCGLHAPEDHPDLPEILPGLCGVSRPLHAEAQWPDRRGAAQLLVAPVLATPGKGPPWGAARLHRFLDGLPPGGPRLLALGGIGPDTVAGLRHPRLAGVAAIRCLWEAPDPLSVVAALRARWDAGPDRLH